MTPGLQVHPGVVKGGVQVGALPGAASATIRYRWCERTGRAEVRTLVSNNCRSLGCDEG